MSVEMWLWDKVQWRQPSVLLVGVKCLDYTRDHQLVGKNYPITKNALLHLQVLGCLLFTVIVYFLSGQPADMGRFNMFFVISLLIVYVAMSFGLMIGAIFDVVVSSRQTAPVPKHHDVTLQGCTNPGRLNFVRWHLILVGPQYGAYLFHPCRPKIELSPRFLKNTCTLA